MDDKPKLGPGRTPPPPEHRFLKGTSGNKRGRPKGAVSLKNGNNIALWSMVASFVRRSYNL